jgi:hypothetical protein
MNNTHRTLVVLMSILLTWLFGVYVSRLGYSTEMYIDNNEVGDKCVLILGHRNVGAAEEPTSMFTSKFMFPSYLEQTVNNNNIMTNSCSVRVGSGQVETCDGIIPTVPIKGISVENKEGKCNVLYTTSTIDLDSIESIANNIKRLEKDDIGTFIIAKQIHMFTVGGMPKFWRIPVQQYNALYNREMGSFNMSVSLWVLPIQSYARNWLQIFGTEKNDQDNNQQCPSIWIFPDESKVQVRISNLATRKGTIINHPVSKSDLITSRWTHVVVRIKPSSIKINDYVISSSIRVIDQFGGIVLEDKSTTTVSNIALINPLRISSGLEPVNNVFCANYPSKTNDYNGNNPSFMLYDVRVSNIFQSSDIIDVLFRQGFEKLCSSLGTIPLCFSVATMSYTEKQFTFEIGTRGMNNVFGEKLDQKIINALVVPPRIELVNNKATMSETSIIPINYMYDISTRQYTVTLKKGDVYDLLHVDKKTAIIIGILEPIPRKNILSIQLSEAYVFMQNNILY